MSHAEWIELPTREEIASALHGDNCPDDPDPDECCSCGAGDYDRMGDIVLDLLKGKAMVRALPAREQIAAAILEAELRHRPPGIGGQVAPAIGDRHRAIADAVLALLKGRDA